MMSEEQTVLPLKTAYVFGSAHNLDSEINVIRDMEIGWDLSYTSTVRRGYIVELFERHGVFDEFKATHWVQGNAPWGEKERRRYLRIKKRFDDYLEGQGPVPDQIDEEVDQQFAAEADLRDFLAKNPVCIEPGLRVYQSDNQSGVEFAIDDGFIDILAIDRQQLYVVVELKLGKGRNKALGQILYYMAWVDKNLGNGPCRGIIIAKDIPDELRLAVGRVPGISLCRYHLSVSVEPVPPADLHLG